MRKELKDTKYRGDQEIAGLHGSVRAQLDFQQHTAAALVDVKIAGLHALTDSFVDGKIVELRGSMGAERSSSETPPSVAPAGGFSAAAASEPQQEQPGTSSANAGARQADPRYELLQASGKGAGRTDAFRASVDEGVAVEAARR